MQEVDTYTGDTSEARFITNAAPPASTERKKLPELNLERAYKTLNFYQEKPQYLANPFTSKVANAHFAQAAKIVGMSIQLERINNSSEAARAENVIGKQVATSLLKLAEAGPDGAGIAAKWYALDENGQPRWKNPANAELIFNDYKNHLAPKPISTAGKTALDRRNLVTQFGEASSEVVEFDKQRERSALPPNDARLLEIATEYRTQGNDDFANKLEAIVVEHGRTKSTSASQSPISKQEAEVAGIKASVIQAKRFALANPNDPKLKANAETLATRLAGAEAKLSELRKQSTPAATPSTNAPAANIPSASKYGSEADARSAGAKTGDVIYLEGIGKVRLK